MPPGTVKEELRKKEKKKKGGGVRGETEEELSERINILHLGSTSVKETSVRRSKTNVRFYTGNVRQNVRQHVRQRKHADSTNSQGAASLSSDPGKHGSEERQKERLSEGRRKPQTGLTRSR